MNVSDNIIHFYMRKHAQLFPTARLLLLRGTFPNMVYRSEAAQKQELQPVIHALLAHPESLTYAHLFSNSGAQQIGLLLRHWKDVSGGKKLPLRGMIFDSTPVSYIGSLGCSKPCAKAELGDWHVSEGV